MSDRKWGIISALAGLAALVTSAGFGAFYGSVYAPTNEPYHSITANGGQTYPSDSPRNGLADVAGINSVVQSAIAKPQPRNTYEREQRDLAAQESMAVFAYWMFVAVVFQSLFALGALFALLKDLRQNRDSAQQQLRAYVAFKLRPDTRIEPETPIFVSLDVMNYGQTPARNVEFQYATAYNPRDWAWEKDAEATRTTALRLIFTTASLCIPPLIPENAFRISSGSK